jgi:hypothetical protein
MKKTMASKPDDIAETLVNMHCGACHGDDSSDNQPTNSPDEAFLVGDHN